MDFLIFENISKSYGSNKVIDNLSIAVQKGEIFSLLGPSGCGKTTLLRIAAGFEEPDSGRVILDGQDITNLPPNKRKLNTVFQNYALFPHLTVRDNIAFGLKVSGFSKEKINDEVERYLDLIQMTDHASKKPSKLSGGQKQRVAIARALINKPDVLLLDEPLAALDLKLRQRMLVDLDWMHDEVGITFLYVTHDQSEAMSISDTIAVMNKGRIEQKGTSVEVYEAPRTSFVAAFIGDTNFFDGEVKSIDGDYCLLSVESFPDIRVYNDKAVKPGGKVYLSIRPEKIGISHNKPSEEKINVLKGKVEEIIYLGSHTKYWISVNGFRISVIAVHNTFMLDIKEISFNDEVYIYWSLDSCYMLEQYKEEDEALLTLPDDEILDQETV
ncbi:MAG TPA: ABC transporter ATP-binding protein [Spirochaetota bacterium]|nr:ABC transporter ATP-binding protein [Spirochaetota bacterium]HOR43500.1 ABC transporter ATP-binding protein [Spirochaetota bacterium]HOU83225.1 ABC transporter ATP-binding protein [Spirochaetota bacterium]HPK55407.1 ABC transporter ATP-binding protein [Spirochaetota bacterium]HQE57568.1 ABC transporter ATP-binding protein [Spirochaetota bacterium]